MMPRISLDTLSDPERFRQRRAQAWARNVDYWLTGPLRHVVDVGEHIAARAEQLCRQSGRERPVVVDMGFGDAWLLRALLRRGVAFSYIGMDCTRPFVEHARAEFAHLPHARFEIVDLELPVDWTPHADVVVNSFAFFEFCDLRQGFSNASHFLSTGGTLLLSTIDKTYLMLALSQGWEDFLDKLELYQTLPGTKYAFQPIDLDTDVSATLEYPSVLYSMEDYFRAGQETGLVLRDYKEHAFTAKLVPKIYCHYEFEKKQACLPASSRGVERWTR